MRYLEPHAHMVSRVTDDYVDMLAAGCAAVCEPAFWAGFDRSSPAGFYDYFSQLTDYEPKRAAKFGLPHYCWLCINPKESEDVKLAEEVLAIIPKFLGRPNVLGIGEIGLNKNTRNEITILEEQVQLAAEHRHVDDAAPAAARVGDRVVNGEDRVEPRDLEDGEHAPDQLVGFIGCPGHVLDLPVNPAVRFHFR